MDTLSYVKAKKALAEAQKPITPQKTTFLKLSKNLFDKTNVVEGNVSESTGNIAADANYVTANYQEVKPNTKYMFVKGYKIAYYNASKAFISGEHLLGTANKIITTPANSKYVRYSIHKTILDTQMFVEGESLPSTYEAFGGFSVSKENQEKQIDLSRSNLSDIFSLNADLANGTDLNTVKKEGHYTGVANGNYLNRPSGIANSTSFLLRVTPLYFGGNRWFFQEITDFNDSNNKYTRRLDTGGSGTTSWKSNKPLAGKVSVHLGDSVTEFGDYPTWIGTKTGLTTHNCGFGGTRMAFHTDANYDKFSGTKIVDAIISGDFSAQDAANATTGYTTTFATLKSINFNNVDFVTFFYGTNDYMGTSTGGSVPLGTDSDNGSTTFKGAINYIVDKLLTRFPHLKIAFVTPTWRMNHSSLGGGDSDTQPNPAGKYLVEYVDAIKSRANANHVPVLDLHRNGNINKYNQTTFLTDSVHPTPAGYELLGKKIGGFLLENY